MTLRHRASEWDVVTQRRDDESALHAGGYVQVGPRRADLDVRFEQDREEPQARSYRSRFMTLTQAATKSLVNLPAASSLA